MPRQPKQRRAVAGRTLGCLVWLAAAVHEASTAQPATTHDAPLLARAYGERPAFVQTLERLVRIETGTEHLEGLARLGDLLQAELAALGARVERVPAEAPVRAADHLVARLRGQGGRRVLLMAHMDTVYPAGTLARAPFHIEGDTAWGPGVADAKGGIALVLHALALMRELRLQDFGEIVVLFNSDEERGSMGSRRLIQQLAREADVVLSFEPTASPQETVPLGTSGIATVTATVKGRAAHAGAAPEAGINALVEAADLVLRTVGIDNLSDGLRFNWTGLRAGTEINVIPDEAILQANLRYADASDLALAEQHLKQLSSKRLFAEATVDIRVDLGRPAFRADAASKRLAALAAELYAEAGGQMRLSPRWGGGTDIAYAALAGKPVLEGLGLPGGGFHSPGAEFADLSAIPRRLYLTVRMLALLGATPEPTSAGRVH